MLAITIFFVVVLGRFDEFGVLEAKKTHKGYTPPLRAPLLCWKTVLKGA